MPDDPGRSWLAEAWADTPTQLRVSVEGASIACRGWRLDHPKIPGIVLVHGFRAHARWWDHIGPFLTEHHRVVALDLSGMGDSERRADYSRAQHGREVLAVADALAMARPTIIAHSYGGVVTLMGCHAAPGRVGRLILIDSALPSAAEQGFHLPTPPLRLYPDRESAVARFRLNPPSRPDPAIFA